MWPPSSSLSLAPYYAKGTPFPQPGVTFPWTRECIQCHRRRQKKKSVAPMHTWRAHPGSVPSYAGTASGNTPCVFPCISVKVHYMNREIKTLINLLFQFRLPGVLLQTRFVSSGSPLRRVLKSEGAVRMLLLILPCTLRPVAPSFLLEFMLTAIPPTPTPVGTVKKAEDQQRCLANWYLLLKYQNHLFSSVALH